MAARLSECIRIGWLCMLSAIAAPIVLLACGCLLCKLLLVLSAPLCVAAAAPSLCCWLPLAALPLLRSRFVIRFHNPAACR